MQKGIFKFKQFEVSHVRSAMKVGVDGVLVGAWAGLGSADSASPNGLDIGAGCGMITLMAAQRYPGAKIIGVEIDGEAAAEAAGNAARSPWSDRVEIVRGDVWEFAGMADNQEKFDFIISNPPFFASGVAQPHTAREMARHQNGLSPTAVLEIAARLLKPGGEISLIAPAGQEEELLDSITSLPLRLKALCRVRDKRDKTPKRVMLCCRKGKTAPEESVVPEILTIRDDNDDYSEAYRILTGPFYLNF